ncbi:MAG: hypothetical protein K6D02_02930 [Lachnospiraceae bacterium]|nr:hypothetical protein [Lachnospiraceae bacterium]
MKKISIFIRESIIIRSLVLYAIIIVICCTGCGKKQEVSFAGDNNEDSSDTGETAVIQDEQSILYQKADGSLASDTEKALKDGRNDKNTVVWIMPYIGVEVFTTERLNMFNQMIRDEKKDFQLEICYVYDDGEESYDKQLSSLIEQGYGDICNTGYTYTAKNLENYGKMKKEGYFRNLTEDLKTGNGKKIREAYSDYVWKSVTEKGEIYTIPNQYFMPHRGYLGFSKKYFKKDIIQKYDDSLYNLSKYLTKTMKKKLGKKSMIWGLSYYDTLNSLGIYELFGVWGNQETGDFHSAYSDKNYKKILQMLHRMHKEKNLHQISDLENVTNIEKIIKKGDFGIAVVPDNIDMELLKKNAYVVELPYYYKGDYDQGNALIQKSKKWEKAMELYGVLISSKKDANCLVYGKENVDFLLKNGFAYEIETGEDLPARFIKQNLGIADQAYNSRTDYFGKDVSKSKKEYFKGNKFHESYFNGFIPDYTKIKQKKNDQRYEDSFNVWREDDFKEKYKELQSYFEKKQKATISQLNEQVGEWKNGD